MDGVDDAGAAAGEPALDGLRVAQRRRHLGGARDEPGARVPRGRRGYLRSFVSVYADSQRRHLHRQPHQRAAVVVEVAGIAHPVFLDVGPARILRVGPPVVPFGEVVVRPARAARRGVAVTVIGGFLQVAIRRGEHARALARRIEASVDCGPGAVHSRRARARWRARHRRLIRRRSSGAPPASAE